ncbi:MAG: hypothetical protein AAFX99_09745 [Myxococcota bacterium]
MLQLDDPRRPMPRALLDAPGGFAWWYLEMLDAQQNGLVLIWAFGLPFIPGYTSDARKGTPQRPIDRPCLVLSLYEKGRPSFYTFHEFAPEEASWDGANRWTFGDTVIERQDVGDQRIVTAHLNCPVVSCQAPIQGTIQVSGVIPVPPKRAEAEPPEHIWTPLAYPARGHAVLQLEDQPPWVMEGPAYHDRNGSHKGLHALGIQTWLWGHASLDDQERVVYLLWPEGSRTPQVLGFEIDLQGQLTERHDLTAWLSPQRRTSFGMPTWDRLEVRDGYGTWLAMRMDQTLDHGPFYLRYTTTVENGHDLPGTAEIIVPERIDLMRHRFMVKMRVAQPDHNSFWLPLFQGPRRGRVQRLVRQLWQPLFENPRSRSIA